MTPLYRAYEDREEGEPYPAHLYGEKLLGAVLTANVRPEPVQVTAALIGATTAARAAA